MLTAAERKFLVSQSLNENDVFDAKGRAIKRVKEEAERLEKKLIIGTPCKAAGHRLRTRAGHCAQCNPANLAYQNRTSIRGYVYIAYSKKLNLIKLGSSTDYETRIRMLNSISYGNTNDWHSMYWAIVDNSGKVENGAHRELQKYAVETTYMKDGHSQISRECFKCSKAIAMSAILKSLEKLKLKPIDQWMRK